MTSVKSVQILLEIWPEPDLGKNGRISDEPEPKSGATLKTLFARSAHEPDISVPTCKSGTSWDGSGIRWDVLW